MAGRDEESPHLESEVAMLQDQVAQLRRALESRDVIGQAKGIIMHSLGCTADEAFDVLVQQSRTENRKLVDVATDLVGRSSRVRPRTLASSSPAGQAPGPRPIDGQDPPSPPVFTRHDGDGGRQLVDHGHDGGADPGVTGDDPDASSDR